MRSSTKVVLLLASLVLAGCGQESAEPTERPSDAVSSAASNDDGESPSADDSPGDDENGHDKGGHGENGHDENGHDDKGAATNAPACDAVWVADRDLPVRYAGCTDDGELVEPDSRMCAFGKRLYTYDDSFWAVPGGRIGEAGDELLEDRRYRQVLNLCSG